MLPDLKSSKSAAAGFDNQFPDVAVLRQRARLIQSLRNFFIRHNYLEVETPLRIPTVAPEEHIVPVRSDGWFLQTSPELCMKRLLAAGVPRIFQICRCFRGNERGSRHLPEFTMLEWYRSGIDYRDLMAECERLLDFLVHDPLIDDLFPGALAGLDLRSPWLRISVAEAFARYSPVSLEQALAEERFDLLMVEAIEPRLPSSQPVFVYDYPARLGALARINDADNSVAERFELYINGLEIANGFSELTEAAEQRRRFERDRRQIVAAGRDPGPMPEKFLLELASLNEAAGIALGVDRLAMVLLGVDTIDEVVAFTPEDL